MASWESPAVVEMSYPTESRSGSGVVLGFRLSLDSTFIASIRVFSDSFVLSNYMPWHFTQSK